MDVKELKRLHEAATRVALEMPEEREGYKYYWLNSEVVGTAGRMKLNDAAKMAYLWNHTPEIIEAIECKQMMAVRLWLYVVRVSLRIVAALRSSFDSTPRSGEKEGN